MDTLTVVNVVCVASQAIVELPAMMASNGCSRFSFPESSGIHDMLSKPAARNWSICSDAEEILEPEKHPRDANSVARDLQFEWSSH